MKKILILVFSNLKHDARVIRQINFLKKRYKLTVCCFDINPTTEYEVIILPNNKRSLFTKLASAILLLVKRYRWAHSILYPYKKLLLSTFNNENFDLIIANDIETLPLAFDLKKPGTKILFDAHEYAPRHFEDKLWWRVFFQGFNNFFCQQFIPKIDGMSTVAQSLADEYEQHFNIKPVVITNAYLYQDLQPVETDTHTIKLVYHGIINPSRRIEVIIDMMNHLTDNFTLDLMLVFPTASQKNKSYLQGLRDHACHNKQIQFKDPVSIEQIIPTLQKYDIGIVLIPPINFNYSNCLPNKLFDCIQARLGVITGPTPEIARIVNTYKVGVVANDFTSKALAEKLSTLTRSQIQAFKLHSHQAAPELCAEKNEVILNDLVASIINKNDL